MSIYLSWMPNGVEGHFRAKPANESLAKNGSKCELFLPFLPFLLYVGMPWHAESMLRKPQVH